MCRSQTEKKCNKDIEINIETCNTNTISIISQYHINSSAIAFSWTRFSDLIPKRLATRGCTSNHGKTTSNQKNPNVKKKMKEESNMEIKIYFPSQRNDQAKPYTIIN